jgi:hypothetical protein
LLSLPGHVSRKGVEGIRVVDPAPAIAGDIKVEWALSANIPR